MWAQLITMRLKPGADDNLSTLFDQLRDSEQPGSGLLRSISMRDQNDPNRIITFVLFESEDKARAREQDDRRQEGLTAVRSTMAELFEGAPEFTDLTVVNDYTP